MTVFFLGVVVAGVAAAVDITAQKSYNLWCDHPDCVNGGSDAFDTDTWPQWRTAGEVRAAAHREGWRRTRGGKDICPDHPGGAVAGA